jgi:DNA modification methylase
MSIAIRHGDCRDVLRTLPDQSVHCCVTSPPYFGLRDYGHTGQIGLEATPDAFVAEMVAVFREVRRVLRDDGTLWLNLGDSYANTRGGKEPGLYADKRNSIATWQAKITKLPPGLKPKDLIGIPWRVAFALQADGWYLRQDVIWSKPNPMPESVRDRCCKSHEYIFLMSKSARYFYDAAAIAETAAYPGDNRAQRFDTRKVIDAMCMDNGSRSRTGNPTSETRNKRSVWEVATQPFSEAHFATFPPALIEPCIKAGCPIGGTVLDPFAGAGTTGMVADRLQRSAILIELNPDYTAISDRRLRDDAGLFAEVSS